MHPDRVVVGADNTSAMEVMKNLYAPFTVSNDRFIGMDIRSAEMTKYAANAMLATKISFINEIANICEQPMIKIFLKLILDNSLGLFVVLILLLFMSAKYNSIPKKIVARPIT